MWQKIKRILLRAPKQLAKFRPRSLRPTSARAESLTEVEVAQDTQDVHTHEDVHELPTPHPTYYVPVYPRLPAYDDTPSYSYKSKNCLIVQSENHLRPPAISNPDAFPVVEVEEKDSASSISSSDPSDRSGKSCSCTKGLPNLPSHFLRRSRSDAKLHRRGRRNHIFDPIYANLPMTADDAIAFSERRARKVLENTVFEAPQQWQEWETRRGKRIVSSEPVRTIQCKRTTDKSFVGTAMGLRYAIFKPYNGHLMDSESLGDWCCQV